MTIPRGDILRMAIEACSCSGFPIEQVGPIAYVFTDKQLLRFADLVIAAFLTRSGQYLTNDASREAAIAEAVAAEREACADAVRFADNGTEAAAIIRARGP